MKYYDGSTTTTTSYTHNDGNQLTARTVGGAIYPYDYDANGNMTVVYDHKEDPVREFTWNRDDRLVHVNNNGSQMQYIYDALGRRIMRLDPVLDVGTIYYYDGLTVIAEKQQSAESGNWDWQRIFTVAPGVIGNIFRISEKSDETWPDAYYHYDAIGNVALRTNGYGSVLESLDQEAYGNVKVGSQTGYHLTTKEYDTIPELYYFSARWYDYNNGTFISKTILPPFKECSYLFTVNNPIKYFDPNGLKEISNADLTGQACEDACMRMDSACRRTARSIRDRLISEGMRDDRLWGTGFNLLSVGAMFCGIPPVISTFGRIGIWGLQMHGSDCLRMEIDLYYNCLKKDCEKKKNNCLDNCRAGGGFIYDVPGWME